MKKFFRNKYFFTFITLTCSGAAIMMLYYIMFKGADFSVAVKTGMRVISPILYGFVMAYILTPMLNYIESKIILPVYHRFFCKSDKSFNIKVIRTISVFLTILTFLLMIILFFRLLVPQVIESIEKFAELFPTYIANTSAYLNTKLKDYPEAEKFFESYFDNYSVEMQNFLTGDLIPALQSVLKLISTNVLSTVVGLVRVLVNVIVGLIVSVYMLYSKELFAGQAKRLLYSVFNTDTANSILKEVRFIHKTFIGFFAGKIIDSAVIGLICFICATILGLPYPILVSLVVGVTNIIPFIGPLIGAIPSAVLIFVVDPKACLTFIIFIIILQQIDGNIIGPKILGESTGLSTFWVIFAITVFGGLYGIGGILIGVPLFAVIYAAIKDISSKLLKDKGLPDYTTAYTYLDSIENGQIVLLNDEKNKEDNEGVVITIKLDNEENND